MEGFGGLPAVLFGGIGILLTPAFLPAQPPLSFEVTSVRRVTGRIAGPPLEVTNGGGLNAHITLDMLLQIAYKVKPFQIVNAPGWVSNEEYAIVAKPPADYIPKQPGRADDDLAQRIGSLLVERFQLDARRETREMPVYALVVGKNGPKLAQPAPDESFKLRLSRGRIANDGPAAMAMLVSVLENQLGRPVIDETGLTGRYKFNLSYAPENDPNPAAPSIFTAIEEQLGLKLHSARRPVEIIVIHRIERPTEN